MSKKNYLQQPRLELGSPAWEAGILTTILLLLVDVARFCDTTFITFVIH